MSDEFFNKIGAKVSDQKAAKAAKEKESETNLEFVRRTIPALAGLAEDYAAKCREQGMSAKVSHSPQSITFTLRYGNGQERRLVGGPDYERNYKLSFEEHYPDNDGKRYKSLPMRWYDESDWSDSHFEDKLKKTIEDFLFYADRFGGI